MVYAMIHTNRQVRPVPFYDVFSSDYGFTLLTLNIHFEERWCKILQYIIQ